MALLTRRRFVRSLGGAALTLPIAGALLRSRGVAQPRDVPVRFLAIRSAHGTDRNLWIPRRADGSEPGGTDVALSDLTFDYQRSLLAPLETSGFKSKITAIDGLDRWANNATGRNAEGHFGAGAALTGGRTFREDEGRTSNASLDQWLYARLGAGEGAHLINASCFSNGLTWKGMSFREDGSGVSQTVAPSEVFGSVFRGFMPDPGMGPALPDRSGAQRGMFDHVIGDLSRLRGELTGAERARLEEHLAAMEALRAEILPSGSMPGGSCTTGEGDGPERISGYNPQSAADFERRARQHATVIAQAFACGLSRVATLMHADDYISPYFDVPAIRAAYPGLSGEFHDPYTHQYWMNRDDPHVAGVWSMAHRWQTELFIMALQALDNIIDPMDPSGTNTVLDNTIVYWVNEFGHGPHDDQGANVPAIIAGGGAGRMRMGRYLRVRDVDADDVRNPSRPVPTGRLLTSIAQAMGHDIGYYGDPGIGADPAAFPDFHGELTQIMNG